MQVLVFSDSVDTYRLFESVQKARGFDVGHHRMSALEGELRRLKECREQEDGIVLVYLDAGGRAPAVLAKLLRRVSGSCGVRAAVIDPRGRQADVGLLFRAGAIDYVGPGLLSDGVDPKRLREVRVWAEARAEGAGRPRRAAEAAARPSASTRAAALVRATPRRPAFQAELSGGDWKAVNPGREYVFTMMFIEIDNQDVLRRDYGAGSLRKFQQTFHDTVCGLAAGAQGRMWMWSEFGGVLLFPFNGERCDAVVTSFRLVLNRRLLSIDMYDFDVVPSFRIALHIGATTFRARGQTGRIVSDSVNSVFHLGQKFAQPGQFCMTDAVEPFIPDGIRRYFVSAGRFEGRDITRMRLPL